MVSGQCDAVLTVDVEEWFHVCGAGETASIMAHEQRVMRNIGKLLRMLAEENAKATFFMLGSVAEGIPELVPLVASAGHEVASHGWSHRLVTTLQPEEFREELRRTAEVLTRQGAPRPLGFRAPQWSLSHRTTPWAFKILTEEGYRYDSSCTPLAFIGDPGASQAPYRMELPQGALWEIPPMVTETPLVNLPTAGGWGFRFFPLAMIEKTMDRLQLSGTVPVLYLHPRELDPDGPRVKQNLFRDFVTYGRGDAAPRLRHLLRRRRFGRLIDMVGGWEAA